MNTRITTLSTTAVASYVAAARSVMLWQVTHNPFVAHVTYMDTNEQLQTTDQTFSTAVEAYRFCQHLMNHHPEVVQVEVEYRYFQ